MKRRTPNKKIVNCVDKHVTCANDELSDDMKDLVNVQMQRHTKTCKKQGNKICRLNFPLPAMLRTVIFCDGAHKDLQRYSFDANLIILKRKLDCFGANLKVLKSANLILSMQT